MHTAAARELWQLLEPIHAVTYFSPEPIAALTEAGFRGFWMGYFAGRAAPLGEASADLVHATFYNFTLDHVARAIPDAWRFASPADALEARLRGSASALGRQLRGRVAAPAVARAAELASLAATHAPLEARPLFAANRALAEPDEPLARLWHAATLLREHRGDGHVASLVTAGITGRESHVLHALHSGTPAEVYASSRRLGEEEWQQILGSLRKRGFVDDAGNLTAAGRLAKQSVEDQTDTLARTAYDALSDAELEELFSALRPITAAVVAAGEIPNQSPIGLDLADTAALTAPG